jgi:hypothetical protein
LFITGISIFALAPALAEDLVQVTADNYVRAESDFQMKSYIENFNCLGKFEVPNWKKDQVEQMRETINVVASTLTDSSKMFGKKEILDGTWTFPNPVDVD